MEDAAGSIVAPDLATLRRIGIAVGLSAAMHLAFVVGVRVAPPRHPQQPSAIEARLRPVEAVPVEASAVEVPATTEPVVAPYAEPPSSAGGAASDTPFLSDASQTIEAAPKRDVPREPLQPSAPPVDPTPPAEAAPPPKSPVVATTPPAPESFGPALEIPQIEDPEFYPARKLDVLPHPLVEVPLRYPEDAAKRDVSGRVVLLLLIDELGMVVEANVISAEPAGVFEEAALESFRHVQFSPAQRNGRVVKSRLPVEVTFDPKVESMKR